MTDRMPTPEPDGRTLVWIVATIYAIRVAFALVGTATVPVLFGVVTDILIPAALAADVLVRPYPNGRPPGLASR